jgi:acyl-CoA synthetase (AMP-forming)/AMP-acid ligase II
MSTNPLGVEEVWAAITSPEDVDIEGLKAHCRSRMPLVFVPSRIVRLSALAINAMGKVDRSRLKDIVTVTAGTH